MNSTDFRKTALNHNQGVNKQSKCEYTNSTGGSVQWIHELLTILLKKNGC